MKGKVKSITLVLIVVLAFLGGAGVLVMNGWLQVELVPGARTFYSGEVGIEFTPMAEIKTKLEAAGCPQNTYSAAGDENRNCRYRELAETEYKEKTIEVYPNGPGWGPVTFKLTENMLWSEKDIKGSPSPEKFKDAVRQDIKVLDNVVTIEENSWKITEMKYPWTVTY